MKFLILAFIFTYSFAFAENRNCSVNPATGLEGILQLAQDVETISKTGSLKIVDIAITHDGSGSVQLYLDEAGNIYGIGLLYNGSEKLQETRTLAEFNSGTTIKYTTGPTDDGKNSPLVLSVKKGTTISPTVGGTFVVTILTDKSPKTKREYELNLKKTDSHWKAYKDAKVITKATISPNISWLQWDGTFSGIQFN